MMYYAFWTLDDIALIVLVISVINIHYTHIHQQVFQPRIDEPGAKFRFSITVKSSTEPSRIVSLYENLGLIQIVQVPLQKETDGTHTSSFVTYICPKKSRLAL